MSILRDKSIHNSIKIASVYIGTVLGAGFASGQEMLKFFAFYGFKGMFGLLITGMLFGIVSYQVLTIIHSYKCKSYKEFINIIMGKKSGYFLEIIVMFFMFVGFCAMFAGSGAMFEQRFNMPFYFGVLLMAICCFITFMFDVKGVVTVNSVLAPLLLIGCILIGLYMWFFRSTIVFSTFVESFRIVRDNWISSSIIYVAYNIITAVVVLCSLGYMINRKYTVILSSFISGVGLGLIGLILGIVVLIYYNDVKGFEIPLLAIVMKYSSFIQYIYISVLLSAMFTTAVANGFGLISRIKDNLSLEGKDNIIIILLVIIGAIAVSGIGFSTMVGKVYPAFGYAGIFEFFAISIFFTRRFILKRRR